MWLAQRLKFYEIWNFLLKSTYFGKSKNFDLPLIFSFILGDIIININDLKSLQIWITLTLESQKYFELSWCAVQSKKNKKLGSQLSAYLLRWNIKVADPQVNFFIDIHTWDDEEDTGTSCSPGQKSSKSEDDCSFIFLN